MLKFCKQCGANLHAVRRVVDTRKTVERLDRSKPWFADIAISEAESKRRKDELDHRRGIMLELRRHNEIKGGVITGSVGLALVIFLKVFMEGLVLSGKIPPDVGEIISRLWVVGVIPLFVGIALLVNGMFVSKRVAKLARQAALNEPNVLDKDSSPPALRSADTSGFDSSGSSVTEGTTKHLS